ncbi:MAG: hypothetical protein RR293_01725 [Bacteroidales bacterium]
MDMFIFSCFTGICYCDLCNLTRSNLIKAEDGSLWIKTISDAYPWQYHSSSEENCCLMRNKPSD